MEHRVLVLGAGIAGLAAAAEISKKLPVTLLEATNRLGGRIHTIVGNKNIPVELGAEFVHGKAPTLWKFIRASKLKTHTVPDRHWILKNGTLNEDTNFWDELAEVTEQIDPKAHDLSFSSFLQLASAPRTAKELARDFVEGFHAAPLQQAGAIGVLRSEKSSEEIDGQKAFRITAGYSSLVDFIKQQCIRNGVRFETNTEVKKIVWKHRAVAVHASTAAGPTTFSAEAALVTLPLGVLQSGAIQFDPILDEKSEIIASLGCGIVTKVILQFRSRFWPKPNFGFIHSQDEWFPTCWSDERGDVLTLWAGGTKGDALSCETREFIIQRALEPVSKLFDVKLSRIREQLLRAETHNWKNDPHARLAYSFIPVGAADSPGQLAEPVAETLYFAGEACDLDYQLGTVHGALQTGLRAAAEIVRHFH